MNDLISRQAAIKELEEKVFHNLTDEFYGAMQVLNELPPAQQWIPVEERFPGYRSTVLVYCSERKNMYCAFFDQGVWWVFGAYCTPISEEVTVWMPLPEPYAPTQSNDSKALDALDSN